MVPEVYVVPPCTLINSNSIVADAVAPSANINATAKTSRFIENPYFWWYTLENC